MSFTTTVELTAPEKTLSDLIRQARSGRTSVPGQNPDRGVDLPGAYRIQAASQGGRILKGYKFGLISPAKQQQMGLRTALHGRIYADMLYHDTVHLNDFIQPRLEPEIALVLRDPIAPGVSTEQVARAVGGYFLGVDILDSVWQGYKFTAPEVVADNTSGGGFLMAGRMDDHVAAGALRLYLNGALQTEGDTAALGDPLERLQWLAQQVGELAAGMILFLGSPAASIPALPGTLEVVGPDGHMLMARIVR